MRMRRLETLEKFRRVGTAFALVGVLMIAGCPTDPMNGAGNGEGTDTTQNALSFDGSVAGKVLTTASTRESLTSSSAAQNVPPEFDTDNTCVRFKDIDGNDLMDPNGQPIGEVPVGSDGTFEADSLPVGTDFTVCGDIGKNGECDVESCVQIPSDDGGMVGQLEGVEVDPLTTVILAKFRELLREKGLNARNLPVSPATVVARIVAAYVHLFEESGIDQELTLADIASLTPDELSELFDTFVPEGARTGMRVVEGNLDLALAADVNEIAIAAAEVFLRAGFPIADQPQGLDLSSLANLDGVEAVSLGELFDMGDPFEEPFREADPELEDFEAAEFGDGVTVYFVANAEPDRNSLSGDDEFNDEDDIEAPDLPVLHDYLLLAMARLQLDNRRITINDLYDLLTSIDSGLGARLTYFIFDPNFPGPPLNVFETANGKGKAINIERIFFEFADQGLGELKPDDFERRENQLRRLLRERLADTIPPTFDRLFGNVVDNRIEGIGELSERIRNARAHLPFSRSGESSFFVVADGDPFAVQDNLAGPRQFPTNTSGIVSAVTVNINFTPDGRVETVEYDPSGNGAFFLGFTPRTDERGIVEFIVRETGRFLHSPRGPVRRDMRNGGIFLPINGQPFIDFVSENGTFYPGTHVSVIRNEFIPEPFEMLPPDPFFDDQFDDFDPPIDESFDEPRDPFMEPGDEFIEEEITDISDDMREEPAPQGIPDAGPHQQLFVLAFTPNGEPVRVDFDRASGQAIVNRNGRYLLTFLHDSHETGLFGLFNEKTGREASLNDPVDFFMAPPERPDRFEDFFNNFDQEDFEEFDRFDEFVDEFLMDIPPDEFFPPRDGEFPPDEEFPPFEEDFPPPDDGMDFNDMPEQAPGDDMTPSDDMQVEETDDTAPPAQVDDDFAGDIILVSVQDIIGLNIRRDRFNRVFGTEVPNEQYDPAGDPYYDDINGNQMQDEGEPTAPFRPTLFDPNDWRSTDIRLYYRRADNNQAVLFENVDFESTTPRTLDGVALVERKYLPRRNAFKFGRPNTAVNLLTAFVPPQFFNGTQGFTENTNLDIFSAIAMINLVMDQVFNVDAVIDIDGLGPLPEQRMLIDAHLFVVPVGDPFVLLMKGFEERSRVVNETE